MWKNKIRQVVPYVPGEQPQDTQMIKLNTNENPYPPSPKVTEALRQLDTDSLRYYPDPKADMLVSALAEKYCVKKSQIFVGVGSDDVLAIAFMTCFNSDRPILFPDISYSFYEVWADVFKIPYEKVKLRENFSLCPEDYFSENHKNGGIVFPNPNAPTGIAISVEEVEKILQHNPEVIVIVDEAYIDFGAKSAQPILEKYSNLLIVQTFSKSRSMAGMRIGFAIGNPELISYMNDVKYSINSYTINQTSLVAGTAAVEDEEYFQSTLGKIIETREWTKRELSRLGFTYPDSQTNFIFATHPNYPAKELFEALRTAHIYVRYFDKPGIDNYLRITIGTPTEMQQLITFLENYE